MGTVSWVVAGLAAFLLSQIVPHARRGRHWKELMVALVAAIAGGMTATALDFGGWKVLEWRAALFAFFVTLAVMGFMRIIRRPLVEKL